MNDVWIKVNGKEQSVLTTEKKRLIDWLREDLGLTGTKESCGTGDCGGCSVLLNGRIVPSCCLLVHCILKQEITTIEGLATDTPEAPVFEAFIKHGAFQCGYCTPGMIIAAQFFLDSVQNSPHKHQKISLEEIKEAIAGNICRCTGYSQIIEAIAAAALALGLDCEAVEQQSLVWNKDEHREKKMEELPPQESNAGSPHR